MGIFITNLFTLVNRALTNASYRMGHKMSNVSVDDLINEILKGDIKVYADDGKLVSLTPGMDEHELKEDNDSINYIKAVEQDFRGNADDLLKNLKLSHLLVTPQKNGH